MMSAFRFKRTYRQGANRSKEVFLADFPSRARGCSGSALVLAQMSGEPINGLREMQNLCLAKLVNLLME